jgi:hypothetical protein
MTQWCGAPGIMLGRDEWVTALDTVPISRAMEFACETCFTAPVADRFSQRGTNSSVEMECYCGEF